MSLFPRFGGSALGGGAGGAGGGPTAASSMLNQLDDLARKEGTIASKLEQVAEEKRRVAQEMDRCQAAIVPARAAAELAGRQSQTLTNACRAVELAIEDTRAKKQTLRTDIAAAQAELEQLEAVGAADGEAFISRCEELDCQLSHALSCFPAGVGYSRPSPSSGAALG